MRAPRWPGLAPTPAGEGGGGRGEGGGGRGEGGREAEMVGSEEQGK